MVKNTFAQYFTIIKSTKMKKLISILLFISITLSAFTQKGDQSWQAVHAAKKGVLDVHYFDNYPFAYTDEMGNVVGIEIEILQEFVRWVKDRKGIEVSLNLTKFDDFGKFYQSIGRFSNGVIGLGSVAINDTRKKEVKFTSPYIKNQSLLISPITFPTINQYSDFPKLLDGKVALAVNNSTHEKELLDIKAKHFPKMRAENVASPSEMLTKMKNSPDYYGYVDLISFWSYSKNSEENASALKIHRNVSNNAEKFAFIMPITSDWDKVFTEFFEGGFGFVASERYQKILIKYLGYEVIHSVELY
jgi:ABC-type amino acid transport substrate-binding protein